MASILGKLTPARLLASVGQLREHLKTPLYANAYLLILNQVISAGLGILYWMLAARFYPPEAVGRSSAIVSTLIFLSALAELSLKSAMTRFVPRAGQQVKNMVLLTYGINLLVTGLITTGFFLIGDALNFTDSMFGNLTTPTLVMLVLSTMFWTVFYVQDGVLMGMRQALWVLLENSFYNFSKIILLALGVFGFMGDGIVASWFIPAPVAVLIVNVLIFTRFIPRFLQTTPPPAEPINTRQAVTSVGGDHVGTLLAETSQRLLPLMVINLISKSANAYFYQAWLIGTMMYLVSSNMTASFTVEAATNPQRIGAYSRRTLRQMAYLVVPMVLVTLAGAPLILSLFGAEYAHQGAPLLRWLALAALPYALNVWFLCYARVRSDIKSVILNQGLQLVFTLGLSYWWMPVYGISSIGVAWLIAQTVIALVVISKTRAILFSKGEGDGEDRDGEIRSPALAEAAESLKQPAMLARMAEPDAPPDPAPIYLFLSPHLDDVVLSAGGYLARLAGAGQRVVIATVFTADASPDWPVTWLAQRNLRAWRLGNQPFAPRCGEDRSAANELGAEALHLGLLDAMYRRRVDGSPAYTRNTVGVLLDAEDAKTTGKALEAALCGLVDRYADGQPLQVFSPLGAGGHVDHQLVRRSAEVVFGRENLIYYEDFPYAARPGVRVDPAGDRAAAADANWECTRIPLTEAEITARIAASTCYTSQISGLFPTSLERFLEIICARLPFLERWLWREANLEVSRQRATESLRGYITQVGGENYWHVSSKGSQE